jgi:hypothetical protein
MVYKYQLIQIFSSLSEGCIYSITNDLRCCMKQYDVVRIKNDIPSEGITIGQIGTILEVYHDGHFEIEISDGNGITLFLGAFSGDILEVVK